jgi:hypothetical protein
MKLRPKPNTECAVRNIGWVCRVGAGVHGRGPWGAMCVMAKVGEAALERMIRGVEINPQSSY